VKICQSCGFSNESANTFCLNCGKVLIGTSAEPAKAAHPDEGKLASVERRVFFSVARTVAWLIAAIALVGMIYAGTKLVPALVAAGTGPKSVTVQELNLAISAGKSGRNVEESIQSSKSEVNASDLAAVDKSIYELLALAPSDQIQRLGGIDAARGWIKGQLAQLEFKGLGDQADFINVARNQVGQVPEADRMLAVQYYFRIAAQHRQEAANRVAAGQSKLTLSAIAFACCAVALMMVSMILVLLAIERNTHSRA
jgi:hypothetical protein